MTTVAIVAEYNPFHNGHLYQINAIRDIFGEDTCIISIMSGNYTQRGEVAIADKLLRAKTAVECGVNLVLELPFPFSISSAEFFASASVEIINSIGVTDYICFGAECDCIETLIDVAKAMLSEQYSKSYTELQNNNPSCGHPILCEKALEACGIKFENGFTFDPNNILALEYIKALIKTQSTVKPLALKRVGASFKEQNIIDSNMQSATAIRNSIKAKDISALAYTPKNTNNLLLDAIKNGTFPTDEEKLSSAVISHFRLDLTSDPDSIHDVGGGLYNRIKAASFNANSMTELVRLSETKKYTIARIRRAIYYSFLGVTSSEIKQKPLYTQILAMDNLGRTRLKEIRKHGRITVLTKPSDIHLLCPEGQKQKAASDRADSVFQLTKPIPCDGGYSLRFTPYGKQGE